jgi:hypothetical protein
MVFVGNIIGADHDPDATEVMMSNGLTSVFLALIRGWAGDLIGV